MKIFRITCLLITVFLLAIILFNGCKPVSNLVHPPAPWQGENHFSQQMPSYNNGKKNVFVIADANLTVLFDMLAPFYLFNKTSQANVYVITKDRTPILVKRDLFILPQLTFSQADSLQLHADVIVIPALSRRDDHQDTVIVDWIKNHFTVNTRLLAICDGASTAAATGLYDGKPLTCHASDYAGIKTHFSKPGWVQQTAYTKSGNLYSTAGVSNAVEGTLAVIADVFGTQTMQQVIRGIAYPGTAVKTTHQSIAVCGSDKFTVLKKVFFKENRALGLMMEDGVDEFELASIIEIYSRSFPASFNVFSPGSSVTISKYGLHFINTKPATVYRFDELHLLADSASLQKNGLSFKTRAVIHYDRNEQQYMLNRCLDRIEHQYGKRFEQVVRISLDYN